MGAESGVERDIVEENAVLVLVQGRQVAGKVRFGDIQEAVAIVVRDGNAHARLKLPVDVIGDSGLRGDVREGAVPVVAIEEAGSHVASHVHIGVAVVVEIRGHRSQRVTPARLEDASGGRDVFESSRAQVAVQGIAGPGESLRTAHHRNPFPLAGPARPGLRRVLQVEVHVVGYENIKETVRVVV